MEIVKFNVGGQHFALTAQAIKKFPETFLAEFYALCQGKRLGSCDDFDEGSHEYFFDMTPEIFEVIVMFYRTGKLHSSGRLKDMCPEAIHKGFVFWKIRPNNLCHHCKRRGWLKNLWTKSIDSTSEYYEQDTVSKSEYKYGGSWRSTLHNSFTNPFVSKLGVFLAVVNIFFVLVTIIVLILGSLPNFSIEICLLQQAMLNNISSTAEKQLVGQHIQKEATKSFSQIIGAGLGDYGKCPEAVHAFKIAILDLTSVFWFTIEFMLRLVAAPKLSVFFCSTQSIVDLVTIVPYYLEYIFKAFGRYMEAMSGIRRVLVIQRMLRLWWLLKLGKFSNNTRILGMALKASVKEILLMIIYLLFFIIVFATLLFYVENGEPMTAFTSIPASAWWALVTLTTIGYGDIVPTTVMGKLIASIATILGILLLAFPVAIMVDNFKKVYDQVQGVEFERMSSSKSSTVDVKAASNATQLEEMNTTS